MNRRIRTIIVDDEPLARRTLEKLLRDDPEVEIRATCSDGEEALEAIEREAPDLVFLDIQMPGMSGFEMLEACVGKHGEEALPFIIFVTAYDEHALHAFEVHALDYLLKPFSNTRFAQALDHAKRQILTDRRSDFHQRLTELLDRYAPEKPVCGPEGERFAVKADGKVTFIPLGSVVWFEAADHYVMVHTPEKSYICRESMAGLEERLQARRFLRIHRSAIVNVEHVRELRIVGREDYEVLSSTGGTLSVSRRRVKPLRALLGL